MLQKFLMILLLGLFLLACESATEPESRYDPPADHTINEDGIKHKPGLNKPLDNCVSCHGGDLKGDSGPSCYTCHGKKW